MLPRSDERLSRIKNDGGRLSGIAIDEVLRIGGRDRADIGSLSLLYTFFPEEYFLRETWIKEFERRLHRLRHRGDAERSNMLLTNFIERLRLRGKNFASHFKREAFLSGEGFERAQLAFYDHHDSHALPAAYYSGFDACAVITMDGNGDWGINHTSGVLKAALPAPVRVDRKILRRSFTATSRGCSGSRRCHEGGRLAAMVIGAAWAFSRYALGRGRSQLIRSLSAKRRRGVPSRVHEESMQGHSRENISAAAQVVLEETGLELVRRFLAETGMRDVALNGGVFANVKLNQRIAELPEVDRVFVFPAMSDTGNAIGAVLLDMAKREPDSFARNRQALEHVYWGPQYTDQEVAAELQAGKLEFVRLEQQDLIGRAADAIHAGRVVGWFQGRMEFGPRALGNRSMLARPTESSINNWLNERLDRSEFMPFARVCRGARRRDFRRCRESVAHCAVHDNHLRRAARMAFAHSGSGARGRHRAPATGERDDQPALLPPYQGVPRALGHSAGAQYELQRA